VLLAVVSLLLWGVSHWFVVHRAAQTSTLHYAELESLAEEIYSSGEISQAINDLPLEAAVLAKLAAELSHIIDKTTDYPGCELYYLHVLQSGHYPILGYGNQVLGYTFLKTGEVWKVGQTCKGENLRYPQNIFYSNKGINIVLNTKQLRYILVAKNNYKYILILEKLMIYTYPFWSGHPELLKPPGCKIYR
jgi:hypothetical protein